ncbi:MAG TPA: SCO family protein [Gemmatimonadaceae bacterium]|nr:SCO family protein [Gemmatimonadaceae bacterium]
MRALILIAGLTLACTPPKPTALELRGLKLGTPIAKPDFTLTATDGQPFSFRERTAGKVALLFFGYLNCPDVCPVHTANLATVIRGLTGEERQKLMFVFVTTDPERDTLPALRKWLNNFDPAFVGLRGPIEEVNAIQQGILFPASFATEKQPDGSYGIGHGTAVIAFEMDDSARVVYPFGIRQEDWAHDLPKLLARKR